MKPGDAGFLEVIEKFGWHVMNVAPRVDSQDKQEWFSYTTGLFRSFQSPEIILCGLGSDVAWPTLNEIGNAFKAGRKFELEKDYTDIFAEDVKCRFRAVDVSRYGDYVGWSQWFYEGSEFPLWQCFWPDKNGYYPWEESCHRSIVELQPLLYQLDHSKRIAGRSG
ncbi:MAG TPA: DUF4262 domain-containing protein [Candidatus Angelobacter sp.]|nr:DUF4262 domain-containing protein [Candidatus Angelobacter sp.]